MKCDNCNIIIITDKNKQIIVLVSGTSCKINQVKKPNINVDKPNPTGLTYQYLPK